MSIPLFIGDEISAAAWRLAGVHVQTPARADLAAAFEQARGEAPLILITAEYAAQLPAAVLREAQAAREPPCLVVPDMRGGEPLPDLVGQLQQQLGVII